MCLCEYSHSDHFKPKTLVIILYEPSCRRVGAPLAALLSELFPLFLFLISFAKWPKRHANT